MRYVMLRNNVMSKFNNLRKIGQLYYALLLHFFENHSKSTKKVVVVAFRLRNHVNISKDGVTPGGTTKGPDLVIIVL